jgi:hypothetical protein
MTHAPRIPKEQLSFADKGGKSIEDAAKSDRRDLETEIQTGQPGDADVNTKEQGRYGNIKQNTTHQGYQQDR